MPEIIAVIDMEDRILLENDGKADLGRIKKAPGGVMPVPRFGVK